MEKVLFFDEEGTPVEFIIEASFKVDDTDYVAMVAADEPEEQLYIMRIEEDEHGEPYIVGIDDEELKIAQEVYEELIEENMQ